ncbi:plasmid segregation protein ParM [Pseudorhodoferax soli]|uniref:Plasmid segregation protein ParM n=2 Tax=Pseudorhodoferax soli TaxID=545864 RepID=A0A368Y2D6_9BURK|nr:PRTRC system protein D [Pseudorhodoferax soli]RCW72404.1 plasmid segregation protein ParM [Pseudorhodoferax soli]
MNMVVRSIDVGFGNTKFVVGHSDKDIKCACFPSLAYTSAKDPSVRPSAERRRTVAVPIDGLYYEVGPDVHLAADNFRATQLHDQYVETPEYLALARGALSYMKVDVIDLLMVGLPVSSFQARKGFLERLMTGVHALGGGKTVEVRRAVALAQPQGALVYYTAAYHKQRTIEHEQSLIVDPGSRTFDWLLSRGMRLVLKVSNSVNRGMSDVLKTIAQEISSEIGRPYSDLPAIDTALRTGKPLLIYQKPFDLTPILPTARAVARGAVSSMMEWVTEDYSIQNVILVGGGAFMFKDAIKAAFPNHKIQVVREPMHANVKGFQIAGSNLMEAESQESRRDAARQ